MYIQGGNCVIHQARLDLERHLLEPKWITILVDRPQNLEYRSNDDLHSSSVSEQPSGDDGMLSPRFPLSLGTCHRRESSGRKGQGILHTRFSSETGSKSSGDHSIRFIGIAPPPGSYAQSVLFSEDGILRTDWRSHLGVWKKALQTQEINWGPRSESISSGRP